MELTSAIDSGGRDAAKPAGMEQIASVQNGVDGAGGVPKWFVALVNHNAERRVAQRLAEKGYETYVAIQPTLRLTPSGRRRKIDKVMIPSHVFVRCTEAERRLIVTYPYINRFLSDRSRQRNGRVSPPAVIPAVQLDTLRFMLGQSDHPVTLSQSHYRPGDKVRVIRGALRGLEGEVISHPAASAPDKEDIDTEIIVRLDLLGTARVFLSPIDLSPLSNS